MQPIKDGMDITYKMYYICPYCKEDTILRWYNYCPNCRRELEWGD